MNGNDKKKELRAYIDEKQYSRFRDIVEHLGRKDIDDTEGIKLMIDKFPAVHDTSELHAFLDDIVFKRFREIAEFLGYKDIDNANGLRILIEKFPLEKLREATKNALDALLEKK